MNEDRAYQDGYKDGIKIATELGLAALSQMLIADARCASFDQTWRGMTDALEVLVNKTVLTEADVDELLDNFDAITSEYQQQFMAGWSYGARNITHYTRRYAKHSAVGLTDAFRDRFLAGNYAGTSAFGCGVIAAADAAWGR